MRSLHLIRGIILLLWVVILRPILRILISLVGMAVAILLRVAVAILWPMILLLLVVP